MKLDKNELLNILDVKSNCSVSDLTKHINTLAMHFGGEQYSEDYVMSLLYDLADEKENGVELVLLKMSPFNGIQEWCVAKSPSPSVSPLTKIFKEDLFRAQCP